MRPAARAGLGVALLALAGPPPEGRTQRHDLPGVPPITLTARSRPGADARATRIAVRELRSTLVSRSADAGGTRGV